MFTKNKATCLKCSVVSLLACFGIAGSSIAIAKPHANLHKTNLNQVNIKTVNAQQIQASDLKIFKLKPRVNVWGFTGDRTLAETQILFPLKGDNNKVLYAIAEGNYTKNDSSWMAGFGFGYRQIVDGKILGGYAIADYFNTSEHEFVIANPGIEVLGFHDAWDFSLNGYIPLDRQKKTGKEGWAGDDFENYNFGRATGHNFYDHRLQTIEEVGAGVDIEIGRTLPWFSNNTKLYLGGYHFDTQDSGSINGISTRFTYDINKYTTLELENSYDNLHKNQFLVGIRFSLGGYSQDEKQQFGLATRLLDPRNQGMYRALIKESVVDKGEQLQHDNVWYFKPGEVNNGSNPQGNGTAEDPLINFTPANYNLVYANKNIGTIDAHPLMYFASGEYSFADFSVDRDGSTIDHRFALENGWGMYGRSSDYRAKANGDERASFAGGLDMDYDVGAGINATTLSSIMIYNAESGLDEATLYIKNANNVIFDNVLVQKDTSLLNEGVFGIYVVSSTLNFNKGINTVYVSGAGASVGIYTVSSAVNFNNGVNVVNANGGPTYGIFVGELSSVTFNGGENIVNANSDYNSYGIYADEGSSINFYNGSNAIDVSSKYDNAYGLYAENFSIINFNGGINNIDATSDLYNAYGICIKYDSTLNFINGNNTIDFFSTNTSYGIYAKLSTINFNGGVNNIDISSEGSSYGVYLDSASLNFNGGNNIIKAKSYGLSTSSGIYAKTSVHASIVNFNDGINTIDSFSSAGNSVGVDVQGNTAINFNGGTNTIKSSALSGEFSYGIYIDDESSLNFNANTILNIDVSGNKYLFGIHSDYNSSINYWNGSAYEKFTADNIRDITRYVNFTKNGEGIGFSKKVYWSDIHLDW